VNISIFWEELVNRLNMSEELASPIFSTVQEYTAYHIGQAKL